MQVYKIVTYCDVVVLFLPFYQCNTHIYIFETEVNLRVNLVHSYDEEEYLFNNYDFHGHWVRGSGVRVGL